MANMKLRLITVFFLSIASLLSGCRPPDPSTVTVPANDPTSPTALWLQADVPDRPLGNAYLNGASSTMDLGEPGAFTVTAMASDNDGGIREVRIFYDVTLVRGSTTIGPGLQSGPIAVTTAKVRTTIDSLAELRNGAHDVRVRLWAEAENFSGGIVRTPYLTVPSRLLKLRLYVVALADDDGSAAATVSPSDFATLVDRVNRTYKGTMIRFVFDPTSDFMTMNSTKLNREQPGSLVDGNAIAMTNQGRIPLLLRFGSGTSPTGNGNGWPPLPPVPPAGHPITPTKQQDFVWLPNNFSGLNLWDGGFLAHELGHYLGLYHTFPSWGDSLGDIFGGVKPTSAAQADQLLLNFIASHGGTVDAALDGDRISDTPPDPSNLFYTFKGNFDPNPNPKPWCTSQTMTISGTLNGTQVTFTLEPDTRNVMSYFDPCTMDNDGLWSPGHFTKGQIKQMQDTLFGSPQRRHLLPP